MYFPSHISELLDSLKSDLHKGNLSIIDDYISQIQDILPFRVPSCHKARIIDELQELKLYATSGELENSIQRLIALIQELSMKEDVKAFKNLYIFIIIHPKQHIEVANVLLSNINYLHKMTRDVVFIVPGYKPAKEGEEIVNATEKNMPLIFDENLFIEIIQDLENKSNNNFLYKNKSELLFVGKNINNDYDFNTMQRLDLQKLLAKRVNPVDLVMSVANQFRIDENPTLDIQKHVAQILGELIIAEPQYTKKMFIAGSKKNTIERAILREEVSKVENYLNLDIRSLTFEDFSTSLTGQADGRQKDYNQYITDDADVVVFIFDKKAGHITEEEFNIAYDSLINNQHPNIFVYVRKRKIMWDKGLRRIKQKVFDLQREYYVEYDNNEQLRYLFFRDMIAYFKDKNQREQELLPH